VSIKGCELAQSRGNAGGGAGSKSASQKMETSNKITYDEQIKAIDALGNPIPELAYFIETPKGAVYHGKTNFSGDCERVETNDLETLKVWFGISAIQKINEAKK
jgi:uncharacterized protein (DUF2345 family)